MPSELPSSGADETRDGLGRAAAAALHGDYRQAVAHLEQALAQATARGNAQDRMQPDRAAAAERATLLSQLAHMYPRLGELRAALRCAGEALALSERADEPGPRAQALTALAYVYAQLLLGREALETALRACDAARLSGEPLLEAWALNRVGVAYGSLDSPIPACELTRRALALAQGCGDIEVHFSCLNNLAYHWLSRARLARQAGDPVACAGAQAEATGEAGRAVALARDSGSHFMVAVALSNLAEALVNQGAWDRAMPIVDEYEALALRLGYPDLIVQAAQQRALQLMSVGEHPAAVARLTALFGPDGTRLAPKLRRSLMYSLYEAHKACGDAASALSYLERHVELERQITHDTKALQAELLQIRDQARQAEQRAEVLEREKQQLRDQAERLGRAAHEDALTGLHNRRHAEMILPLLVEGARLQHQPICVAMLDIDHFKRVNDRFGHPVGDQVLKTMAQLLRQKMRSADLLARIGGEEFLIVFVGTPMPQAHEICERLRQAVANHCWEALAGGLRLSISIGLTGGEPDDAADALLERADRALYAAKHGGRDRVQSG